MRVACDSNGSHKSPLRLDLVFRLFLVYRLSPAAFTTAFKLDYNCSDSELRDCVTTWSVAVRVRSLKPSQFLECVEVYVDPAFLRNSSLSLISAPLVLQLSATL